MKTKKISHLTAALLVTAIVATAGCGRGGPTTTDPAAKDKTAAGQADDKANTPEEKAKDEGAVPVEVAVAKREAIVASYTGTASLEPEREAQVVAKTSGVLQRLLVEEGDLVREGQVLARIDPERPQLELSRAQANLSRLENDFRRAKELFGSKLISQESYDKIKFDLDTQRAAFDLAKLELSYTSITAPISGVISQRLVKEGNLIQLHTALFRIDDFDPLLAVLNVPERELNILRPGLAVTMAVDALPGKAFAGTVQRVSPVVDPQTGTFRVTCEFHDDTNLLKSGMFGRVSVVYDEHKDALVISREALIEGDGETAVYLVDKGKAHRVAVTVGYAAGDRIEIATGLKDGDTVVTVGRAGVRDGAAVQVLESVQ
jgi:membrane fusion protein, multidrug efflux system